MAALSARARYPLAMHRRRLRIRLRALAIACLVAGSLGLLASAASASDGAASPGPDRVSKAWVGRFCPIGGCTGPPGNGLMNAAGFAAAVMLAGWWVRQRPHRES